MIIIIDGEGNVVAGKPELVVTGPQHEGHPVFRCPDCGTVIVAPPGEGILHGCSDIGEPPST